VEGSNHFFENPLQWYNTLMLVVAFIQWWYGPGWNDAASRLKNHIRTTYLSFSIPILLATLFEPWKRIISPPGASLQDKFRALGDNAISRAVGFTVRVMVLIAAAATILFYAVFGGLLLILWPFLPILGPVMVVGGLVL
jgi:hypothetical protein